MSFEIPTNEFWSQIFLSILSYAKFLWKKITILKTFPWFNDEISLLRYAEQSSLDST